MQFTLEQRFMAAALRLARRNIGRTADNPCVGALVVKNNEIVGRGVTSVGGRPHAETQALIEAGDKAELATLYVTLEPCFHHGKTPPCVDAIIKSKVSRVVIGVEDPDQRVCGKSIALMRKVGIEVVVGILSSECVASMADYFAARQLHRPYVTVKMASTLDEYVALTHKRLLISGKIAWRQTQLLRSRNQAILVGSGTVAQDNPMLTCRLDGLEDLSPIRLVVDKNLQLPFDSLIFQDVEKYPTWVFCSSFAALDKIEQLQNIGVRIISNCFDEDRINLNKLLSFLVAEKITSLLVEGGVKLATSFLEQQLIDKFIHIQSQSLVLNTNNNTNYGIKISSLLAEIEKTFDLDKLDYYDSDNWYEWRRRI